MQLQPKMRNVAEQPVLCVNVMGDFPANRKKAWEKMREFAIACNLSWESVQHYSISGDRGQNAPKDTLPYDACIVAPAHVEPSGDIQRKTIPGGTYAVFEHRGAYEDISKTFTAIWQSWLPNSGCVLRDVPCFCRYLAVGKTQPDELITEIYIPVEKNG